MAANVKDIKEYFNYRDSQEFVKDWNKLSDEEKSWFKEEVGKEIGK